MKESASCLTNVGIFAPKRWRHPTSLTPQTFKFKAASSINIDCMKYQLSLIMIRKCFPPVRWPPSFFSPPPARVSPPMHQPARAPPPPLPHLGTAQGQNVTRCRRGNSQSAHSKQPQYTIKYNTQYKYNTNTDTNTKYRDETCRSRHRMNLKHS